MTLLDASRNNHMSVEFRFVHNEIVKIGFNIYGISRLKNSNRMAMQTLRIFT